MPDPSQSYRFGPFRYDPAARLLFRGDAAVPLEPKIVDTLEALLERRGQVIEKADLIRRVWPDCLVEDVGLSRNISILRKALNDDAGAYVETIPKRGYRFAAAVVETGAPEPAGLPPPRPRGRYGIALAAGLFSLAALIYWQFYLPSRYLPAPGQAALVAVIPVECLTPELERDAFAEGFTAALVSEMSRLEGVQLISPSTVSRYRGVGIPTPVMTRVLGVQVIVEGTAQVFGDRLGISLRMSDVHSGKLIWSEVFDAADADRRQAQSDVARAAAGRIAPLLRATP